MPRDGRPIAGCRGTRWSNAVVRFCRLYIRDVVSGRTKGHYYRSWCVCLGAIYGPRYGLPRYLHRLRRLNGDRRCIGTAPV